MKVLSKQVWNNTLCGQLVAEGWLSGAPNKNNHHTLGLCNRPIKENVMPHSMCTPPDIVPNAAIEHLRAPVAAHNHVGGRPSVPMQRCLVSLKTLSRMALLNWMSV